MTQRISNFQRLGYKLYPLGINAYYRCPKKFEFRHIAKAKLPYVFKPVVAFGGATHKVLAHQLNARKNGTDPGDARELALDYLNRESRNSPDSEAFVRDYLDKVVEHVSTGLDFVPDESTILAVEQMFAHRLTTPGLSESLQLCAKIDLVFRRGDGTIEHADFKTGKQAGDLFQNFICRLTVASELGTGDEQLHTSNIMTATGTYIPVNSSRDANASVWNSIKEVIEQIEMDQEWRPKPEPAICRWCDFNSICEHADLGSDDTSWSFDG